MPISDLFGKIKKVFSGDSSVGPDKPASSPPKGVAVDKNKRGGQSRTPLDAAAIRTENMKTPLDAANQEKHGEKGASERAMMSLKPVPTRIDKDGNPTTAYIESPGERDAIAPGGISLSMPRMWHYVCAHQFLPGNLKNMGYGFVGILMQEQLDYVERHWASQKFKVGPGQQDIPPDGLGTFPFEFPDGRYGLVIRMTPPMAMAEAFFIAVVGHRGETRSPRYITLELTGDAVGSNETVLCEWASGMHTNHGKGPLPSVNRFLGEIQRVTA